MIWRPPSSTLFPYPMLFLFFFNDTATTEIYTLSLHDALPISELRGRPSLSSAVDEEVDLLVVEGDHAGDLLALGQGRGIRPGQVLVEVLADAHRPCLGLPLVGAVEIGRAHV